MYSKFISLSFSFIYLVMLNACTNAQDVYKKPASVKKAFVKKTPIKKAPSFTNADLTPYAQHYQSPENKSYQKNPQQTTNQENQYQPYIDNGIENFSPKSTRNNQINQPVISQQYANSQAPDYNFEYVPSRFKNWLDKDPYYKQQANDYYKYLYAGTGGYVPPLEQMLRSARSWKRCKFDPYTVPPMEYWDSMISTLRLIKLLKSQHYLPDDFEIVSAYRDMSLNRCARGSSGSKHIINAAVDIKIPYQESGDRSMLESNLCRFWVEQGELHAFGLGIYRTGTLHFDTQGYRTWGSNYRSSSSPCQKYMP